MKPGELSITSARTYGIIVSSLILAASLLVLSKSTNSSNLPVVKLGHIELAWNEGGHSPRSTQCNPSRHHAKKSPSAGGSGGSKSNGPGSGPPDPSSQGPSQTAGDPCNVFDGDFMTSLSVFNVSGRGIQPSLALNYDSIYAQDISDVRNTGGNPLAFGYGWTSPWNVSLDFGYDPIRGICGVTVNQVDGSAASFVGKASGTSGPSNYCNMSGEPQATFTSITPDSFGQPGNYDGVSLSSQTGSILTWYPSLPNPGSNNFGGSNFTDVYLLAYGGTATSPFGSTNDVFSESGKLIAIFDENGNTTSLAYTSSSITIVGPGGRTLILSLDSSGQVIKAQDPMGRTATFSYNGTGDLTSYTDPTGAITTFTYSVGANLITSLTDPEGGKTTNTYGTSPMTFPSSQVGVFTLFPVVSQSDPMGRITTFCYYNQSANSYSSNPSSCPNLSVANYPIVEAQYPTQMATVVIAPGGQQTLYTYRSDGLMISSITTGFQATSASPQAPSGSVWKYYYNTCPYGVLLADPCQVTDPNGNSVQFTYDSIGDVMSYTDGDGNTWSYTYDSLDDLTSITPPVGPITTFTYDSFGNLVSEVVSGTTSSSTTSYSYSDPAQPGMPTSATDPNGNSAVYHYDAQGDLTSMIDQSGRLSTYSYDADGELIGSTDPSGNPWLPVPALPIYYQPSPPPPPPQLSVTITSITPDFTFENYPNFVTVSGTGFSPSTTFSFGNEPATFVNCPSATYCRVLPPSLSYGTVEVSATTGSFVSNLFQFDVLNPQPAVQFTSFISSPNGGTGCGGLLPFMRASKSSKKNIQTMTSGFFGGGPIPAPGFGPPGPLEPIWVSPSASGGTTISSYPVFYPVEFPSFPINGGIRCGLPTCRFCLLRRANAHTGLDNYSSLRSSDPIEYIVDNANDVVDPIDLVSGASLTPIEVGSNPIAIGFSPTSPVALVANYSSGSVTPINLSTDQPQSAIAVCPNPTGVQFLPSGNEALVSCYGSNQLIPIDFNSSTFSVQSPISLGKLSPLAISMSGDGSTIFVSGVTNKVSGAGSVEVISTTSMTQVGKNIPVGNNPFSIALSPDNTQLFVANYGSDSISVVSTALDKVTTTIALAYQPLGINPSFDGTQMFVGAYNEANTVIPINIATDTLEAPISLSPVPQVSQVPPSFSCAQSSTQGNTPTGPCLPLPPPQMPPSPTGCVGHPTNSSDHLLPGRSVHHSVSRSARRKSNKHRHAISVARDGGGNGSDNALPNDDLYMAIASSDQIGSFDLSRCQENQPTRLGGTPNTIVATPDGRTLYSVDFNNGTVSVIDTRSNTVSETIKLGQSFNDSSGLPIQGSAVLSPNGKTLYIVGGIGSSSVIPVDLKTGKVEQSIPAGPDPIAIALAPDGRSAWVTNFTAGTLRQVNLVSKTDSAPISVGNGPIAILIDSSGNRLGFDGSSWQPGSNSRQSIMPKSSSTSRTAHDNGNNGFTIWVVNYGDGTIVPVDSRTGTVGTPINVGAGAISIVGGAHITTNSRDSRSSHLTTSPHDNGVSDIALVAAQGASQLVPVDLRNGKLLTPIAVPSPVGVLLDSSGLYAFASSPTQGTVTAIDLSQGKSIFTLNSGLGVESLAIAPAQHNESLEIAPAQHIGSRITSKTNRLKPHLATNSAGETTYSYDQDGRLIQVVGPPSNQSDSLATTNYTYDSVGNLVSVTDPNGDTTSATYDADFEVTSVTTGTQSSASTTSYKYDMNGNVVSETNGAGDTTTYSYNDAQYPFLATSATDPLGNVTTYSYDPAGNLASLLDPMDRLTSLLYDASNRLTDVVYAGVQQAPLERPKLSSKASQAIPCLLNATILTQNDCLFAVPQGTSSDPQTTWTNNYVSSAPVSTFWSISCADANDCVTVGEANGTSSTPNPLVSVTTNGGKSWTDSILPGTGILSGISCPSVSDCIASGGSPSGTPGSDPLIFQSSNGGLTWNQSKIPSGISAQGQAVGCASSSLCFVELSGGQILKSTDGGQSWTSSYSNSNIEFGPQSQMSCPSATQCIGVALNFQVSNFQAQVTPVALVTYNSGANWSLMPMGPSTSFQSSFDWPIGVSCSSSSACAATGMDLSISPTSGVISQPQPVVWLTSNGGQSWASLVPKISVPAGSGVELTGIECSGLSCIAAGVSADLQQKAGGLGFTLIPNGPVLEVSSDGGTTWQSQSAPVPSNPSLTSGLSDVTCASPSICFAVGAQGSSQVSGFSVSALVIQGTIAFSPTSCNSPNICTIYSYDQAGRLISMDDQSGKTTYSYDPLGNLASVTDGNNQSVSYAYDSQGNEICIAYPVISGSTCNKQPSPTNSVIDYEYNPEGQMSLMSDWKGNAISFGYDAQGNLSQVNYPQSAPVKTSIQYDGAGNEVSISSQLGNFYPFNLKWVMGTTTITDQAGLVGEESNSSFFVGQSISAPTNINFSYDSSERLISSQTSSATSSNSLSYAYDSANRLTQMSTQVTSQNLSYNKDSELCGMGISQVSCPTNPASPSSATRSFTYDLLGNRISQSGSVLSGPQSPYSFQYSRAGNMTCATPGISLPTTGACPSGSYSYTYDGNGLRASSTAPNGAISNFTYNLTSAIPQILTDSTNAYIYGPSGTPLGNAPLEQISISQPTQLPLYLLSGPSGVTNTFDSEGLVGTQSYDPWGNITSSTDMTTPFGYQGAYTDPSGFQYLINRYYDPSTGQFTQEDPLGFVTRTPYANLFSNLFKLT